MNKSRLEAFSDGVFAIIITIMVLELKIPEGTDKAALLPLIPKFISYVLSFVFVGIYWVNHHHLMHTVKKINAGILWGNMHLLFWLSLVPFATGWMGGNSFERITVATYGAVLILCGTSFTLLARMIQKTHTRATRLTEALAKDNVKGYISAALYAISIPVALFVHPLVSALIFVTVSIMWIIPSKSIEEAVESEEG